MSSRYTDEFAEPSGKWGEGRGSSGRQESVKPEPDFFLNSKTSYEERYYTVPAIPTQPITRGDYT